MKETLGITNVLCHALQQKSQYIVNAMQLVRTTKALIQNFREDGWGDLLKQVKVFCQQHHIDFPNFNAFYTARRGRARHQ